MSGITIAIDGPASSGKGTVARGVAQALGYAYIDTGAMYRAVALMSRRAGVALADAVSVAAVADALDVRFVWEESLLRLFVGDEDVTRAIRQDQVSADASVVSAHPQVRAALLDRQRALGADGGVVMDGRDVGTVVLPGAHLKVFLDADLDERARRRHEELLRRGESVALAGVRAALAERDRADRERAVAPLRAADDAVHIDSTDLSIPEAIARVVRLARARGA